MTKRIFKDFDLPAKHLAGEQHFVPAKARDEAEIERRRQHDSGHLVLEQQRTGLEMAALILPQLRDPEDITYATDTLSVCAMNTAWYLSARDAEQGVASTSVQRRRLKLEDLTSDDPEQRPTAFMLLQNATGDFEDATDQSQALLNAFERHLPTQGDIKRKLARTVGHGSLTLSCVSLGDMIGYESAYLTDYDLQDLARQRGLRVLEQSRVMQQEIGTPPSIAQLADPDSDMSVYWRRNAPNGALAAYQDAVDMLAA